VYEEKMAQLYDIENAKHLVKDKKYFDSAVTRQSTVDKVISEAFYYLCGYFP
jgi:hypothetical protein